MASSRTRQNRREARHWRDAAEEALRHAERKLNREAHKDILPPAITGDIWRATLLVNKFGEKGYKSKYTAQFQRRFIDQLHQFNDRVTRIKEECSKQNGACIDCNQGLHQAGQCPDPEEEEVDPWETTDESADSETDLISDHEEDGREETVEEWFWRTQRIHF